MSRPGMINSATLDMMLKVGSGVGALYVPTRIFAIPIRAQITPIILRTLTIPMG
jgi:hypothetical protein